MKIRPNSLARMADGSAEVQVRLIYDKNSKITKNISLSFPNKMLVIRAGFHKMLVTISIK